MNNKKIGWIGAGAVTLAMVGLAGCAATSTSATTASPSATSTAGPGGHGMPGATGAASNARSGAAEGGSAGTVDSVTSAGFTMTTVAGQKVTVTEDSSTSYLSGTSTATSSEVTNGVTVLVLGVTSSTTIAASQVIVDAPASTGAPSYKPSDVVAFQQGSQSASKKDGDVPADYTEGSGTIVSGTAADKATEVALAAYPGGVVDRVVKLSDGEYEVHYIGVNWPHHIFVTTDFTVAGAY